MEKVVDGDYGGELTWVENITGDYIQKETKKDLIDYLRKEYFEDENWTPEHSDITKCYIDYYEDTVNVFLTDQGYKDHLKINGHNIGKHDTFGIHAFRNKEIESLYNLIDESIENEKLLFEALTLLDSIGHKTRYYSSALSIDHFAFMQLEEVREKFESLRERISTTIKEKRSER